MTGYHGGKARVGAEISAIIKDIADLYYEECGTIIKGYCESFAGMLGVYRHIPELFKDYEKKHKIKLDYLAGDINGSLIKMWKESKRGWIPPTKFYTKKQWEKLRDTEGTSALKGFIGHAYSFRGIYFSGYVDFKNIKNSSNNIVEIGKKIKRVKFYNDTYDYFSDLKGYILYLDPPYKKTTQFYLEDFDYEEFQDWVQKMSKHNIILISEYSKPIKNCKKIWSKGNENLYLVV